MAKLLFINPNSSITSLSRLLCTKWSRISNFPWMSWVTLSRVLRKNICGNRSSSGHTVPRCYSTRWSTSTPSTSCWRIRIVTGSFPSPVSWSIGKRARCQPNLWGRKRKPFCSDITHRQWKTKVCMHTVVTRQLNTRGRLSMLGWFLDQFCVWNKKVSYVQI